MRRFWLYLVAGALALPLVAQEPELGGSLGMDLRFTSGPNIQAGLNLGLGCGPGRVESRTILSLSSPGLEEENLWFRLRFDPVDLGLGLIFDPCFSQLSLEIRGGWCPCGCCPCSCWPLSFGAIFLLGNLASACQTPNYTMGLVLDVAFGGTPGFLVRSLTGFGVKDLYFLIDDDPWTVFTPAQNWYFEELLHLAWATECLSTYSTWLFTYSGLDWGEFGLSYQFAAPKVELGAAVRLFPVSWNNSWAKFSLGASVDPVTVRSATTFDFYGFLRQEIGVEIRFSPALIYFSTAFDLNGISEILIGLKFWF